MPETVLASLFTRDFLQRLEAISLAARQLVRGRLKAERRSSARGSSVEFAEYRPFTTGDDFRYIDWNAFARWRQLVRENHPDSLMARGVPEEFLRLATSKLAAINTAYAQVLEERGFTR